jgi:hypothetical protein
MDGVMPIIALFFIYLLMMNCARKRSDAPRQWARLLEPLEQREPLSTLLCLTDFGHEPGRCANACQSSIRRGQFRD